MTFYRYFLIKILNSLNNQLKFCMDLMLILKIGVVIGLLVGAYAVLRNLDIVKIILVYFKDLILRK